MAVFNNRLAFVILIYASLRIYMHMNIHNLKSKSEVWIIIIGGFKFTGSRAAKNTNARRSPRRCLEILQKMIVE